MGRSTFEGPILSGDNRFGPQRDVGYTELVQRVFLDFSVTTPGTANYGGGSTQFVTANGIPNNIATIWTPQAGVFSNTGPTAASSPTADTSSLAYRGAVFLLPQQSTIIDVIWDEVVVPVDSGSTAVTAIQTYVSNKFITTGNGIYAGFANQSSPAAGRVNATFTATATGNSVVQYVNSQSTLQDVQNIQPGTQPTWFSQVVVTFAMTTGATGLSSGQMAVTLRYLQPDLNIGNVTTYPYGNFD
jgi:hypothetical protein